MLTLRFFPVSLSILATFLTGTSNLVAEELSEFVRRIGGRTESAVVMVDLSSSGQARTADDIRRLMPKLEQFEHLRELRLSFFVDDDVLAELHPLQHLERLDVTAARVTNEGVRHLQPLNHLSSLVLCRTQITDPGLREVAQIKSLRELDVSITEVSDEGLRHLTTMKDLSRLDISYLDDVTDAGMESVVQLKKLQVLWVYGTALTDSGLTKLTALPRLRELRVERTAVTEAAVRQFTRDRPDVLLRSDFGDFGPTLAVTRKRESSVVSNKHRRS